MNAKILHALVKLGFRPEVVEDFGYGFKYETHNILVMDSDDDYLNLSFPSIRDTDASNELIYYQLMDNINLRLKYVKAYMMGDDIWLSIDRELFEDDNLKDALMSMITRLDIADGIIHDSLEKVLSHEDDEKDDDTDSDDSDNNSDK